MRKDGLSKHLEPMDWLISGASALDLNAAGGHLERMLAGLGADSLGVVFEMPSVFGKFPTADEMFGYFINPAWHEFYLDNQHLIQNDICARHLFQSGAPHFIDARDESTFPASSLTQEEAEFLQLVTDFGMRQTLAMSFFSGQPRRQSILMLNQNAFGSGDLSELSKNHMAELHLAAQFFFEGLHIRDLRDQEPRGKLSPRERDCLSWAATGRSTKEIADLMHLSDDTVNEYFTSAKRKLNANNRTQAVIRAYILSQIAP